MRNTTFIRIAASVALGLSGVWTSFAQDSKVTIDLATPGAKISPTLWGIFFEDINLSADGGIYAEMVRNRSFEDTNKPVHWSVLKEGTANLSISTDRPLGAINKQSLQISAIKDGKVGVVNEGYWGMSVVKGETYDLFVNARVDQGFRGRLSASLESTNGVVYAQAAFGELSREWKTYRLSLVSSNTDPKARLVISTDQSGLFWLDTVSLFPKKTWKGRPNGLRPDLAEQLVGLKPAFMRFPGGCWVEGETMNAAYRWKKTIGDIWERPTQYNIWKYYATHGLGFHEYLQMCEDLGTEPLFVINCGMSHKENVPMEKMDEFVQDALDAIEYCNGSAGSKWGSVRARNGHPKPFNLKYLEIGNENGGPAYQQRYPLIAKAIKERYPEMHLIANEWSGIPTNAPMELVDEHYYNTPEFFMGQANRYDSYKRDGHKIYVGEYAVTQNCGNGNLRGAIGEAAFMTGIERNADVVAMASYAPLFVNVNHRGWNPDLITYDNNRVANIPSYYVQKMFSENRGDVIVPVEVQTRSISGGPNKGMVGVGSWLTQAEFKDLKVTHDGQTLYASDFSKGTNGWKFLGGNWSVVDGALRQSGDGENIHAVIGDANWTDYTYTLKARKLGGREGFFVIFRVQDEKEHVWWNLGGWGNTQHGLEIGGDDPRVPGQIETGRWYDIRVEVKGNSVKCYLDDKLVHDSKFATTKALYASATRVNATGELILKVVNASYEPQDTEFVLKGGSKVEGLVQITELTSANATDENTLDNPFKVIPTQKTATVESGSDLRYSFPPNSLTIFRTKAK